MLTLPPCITPEGEEHDLGGYAFVKMHAACWNAWSAETENCGLNSTKAIYGKGQRLTMELVLEVSS